MRRVPLLMTISLGLAATAASQEIVIEPTNGRTQTTTRVSRPAAVETAPMEKRKQAALPSTEKRTVAKASANREKLVSTRKVTVVETKPEATAAPAMAVSESAEAAPAPKKMPDRPTWALTDTRDARSLQSEIAGALARDPKLSGSAIEVRVDDGSVSLQGRATGTEERLQAQRLAQSYAWNRKVVDHITVAPMLSVQK